MKSLRLTKLLIGLSLACLIASFLACQKGQATDVSESAEIPTETPDLTQLSDIEIRRMFLESDINFDTENLETLKAVPRDQVIKVVKEIRDFGLREGDSDLEERKVANVGYVETEEDRRNIEIGKLESNVIKRLLAAWYLWELGVEREEDERFIVETAQKDDFSSKFHAFEVLSGIIRNGKKEYLPMVFEASLKSDNAFATVVHSIFIVEIENAPASFLEYLAKSPLNTRKHVYKMIGYTASTNGLETANMLRSKIEVELKNENVKNAAEEFLREVKK